MRQILIALSFIATVVFVILGFYVMNTYDLDDGVNAYVGGDAYNYIINANYAIGYFVLAQICAVFSCILLIIEYFESRDQTIVKQSDSKQSPGMSLE